MRDLSERIPLQNVAIWWRSVAPGEGHYESCMQVRPQGPNCFTGRGNNGVREAVLPMPGCKVRAYVGVEPDVLTHAQSVFADLRTHVDRSVSRVAQGEAAGAVRAIRVAGGGVGTNRQRYSVGDRDHSKNDVQPPTFSFGLIASISATRRICCCSTRLSRRYRSISRRSMSVSTVVSYPTCSRLI